MPYAHNGQISQEPIAGGIKITQEQYRQALAGMLGGMEVTIDGGFRIMSKPDSPPPETPDIPVVPHSVTMRQARLALLQARLLDDVAPIIEAMPSPQKEAARIEWEYSQTVERNRELVAFLAPALGLTPEQTDQLFITAAKL